MSESKTRRPHKIPETAQHWMKAGTTLCYNAVGHKGLNSMQGDNKHRCKQLELRWPYPRKHRCMLGSGVLCSHAWRLPRLLGKWIQVAVVSCARLRYRLNFSPVKTSNMQFTVIQDTALQFILSGFRSNTPPGVFPVASEVHTEKLISSPRTDRFQQIFQTSD